MKKGIIFDLDGTLWDASEENTLSWNNTFYQKNINKQITVKDMQGYMGKSLDEIAAICLPEIGKNEALTLLKACCSTEIAYLRSKGAKLYSNVIPTINALLQDYSLFIVSNCQQGYIEAFLQSSGLSENFSDYESYGNTGLSKGKNISLVLKRSNLTSAVYIGDTQGDCNAAAEAGIPFIHAAYGFGKITENTVAATVYSFSDIPRTVESVLK